MWQPKNYLYVSLCWMKMSESWVLSRTLLKSTRFAVNIKTRWPLTQKVLLPWYMSLYYSLISQRAWKYMKCQKHNLSHLLYWHNNNHTSLHSVHLTLKQNAMCIIRAINLTDKEDAMLNWCSTRRKRVRPFASQITIMPRKWSCSSLLKGWQYLNITHYNYGHSLPLWFEISTW